MNTATAHRDRGKERDGERDTDEPDKEGPIKAPMPRTLAANSDPDESLSPLARLAGPIALATGILFTVQQLMMFAIRYVCGIAACCCWQSLRGS
jgi:small neutral amino acid transporter SnatA (MarC family)